MNNGHFISKTSKPASIHVHHSPGSGFECIWRRSETALLKMRARLTSIVQKDLTSTVTDRQGSTSNPAPRKPPPGLLLLLLLLLELEAMGST